MTKKMTIKKMINKMTIKKITLNKMIEKEIEKSVRVQYGCVRVKEQIKPTF